MSEPNLYPFSVHAYGKVSAAGVLTDAVNISGIVKGAAGIYTVNLGSEIDPTQRSVLVSLTGGVAGSANQLSPGTDGTVAPRTFNAAGAATDLDHEITVLRVRTPAN